MDKKLLRNESLKIFKEITKIPRPSGHEEKIIDYLIEFAKKHKLKYKCCGINDIIIYKKATNDRKDKTLILQSHLDMVCEKDINNKIQFLTDSIQTTIEGDYIKAQGTTLGADNGFGVAIILHILKSKKLKHCNLEAVFTSEEETTMKGALSLDYSLLTGKTLISLDGSSEQKIDSASASMTTIKISKKVVTEQNNDNKLKISVSGLLGGHSGEDINKNRINSIKLMLSIIEKLGPVNISSIEGGDKSNAIPHACEIVIATGLKNSAVQTVLQMALKKCEKAENNNNIKIHLKNSKQKNMIQYDDSANLIKLLTEIPHGVIKKTGNVVVTSCNLAKVKTDKNEIEIIVSVRSSVEKYKEKILEDLRKLSMKYCYNFSIKNEVPGFEEDKNSCITQICKQTYKTLYGKDIQASPVHAGLEGGVFKQNIQNLDMCVIGADIFNMHSTQERASISSLQRVEKWVEKIIEEF